MLRFDGIEKSFGEKAVLRVATLTVETGKIAALCGQSGSGKSTLLRIAAGLETADAGTVAADGKIAFVFPEPRLYPTLTVTENVALVMRGKCAENEKRANEILDALGLSEAKSLSPRELSSGMAARVSLARAIAFDADVYLLDEPFSRLDEEIKAKVMAYCFAFLRGKTVLFITHDPQEAERADEVFFLREGKIEKA